MPFNSLTEEGLDLLGQKVGTNVSIPVEGFVNGTRFIKMKILIKLDEPLKDRVFLEHPTLGTLKALCHYEKVSRICLFCGHLGHELWGCAKHKRVAKILQHPSNMGKYNAAEVLAPKFGKWMLDYAFIPKTDPDQDSQRRAP